MRRILKSDTGPLPPPHPASHSRILTSHEERARGATREVRASGATHEERACGATVAGLGCGPVPDLSNRH